MSCGAGTKTRTRVCRPPQNGGTNCVGDSTETTSCQSSACSTNGSLTEWSEWAACSATCEGTQTSTRECIPPQGGGEACPDGDKTRGKACGVVCPVNGVWQDWEDWGSCSATVCGTTGQRTRQRSCVPPQNNGLPCSGLGTSTEACNASACVPVDGEMSDWGQWGACSATCAGQRERTRTCVGLALHGGATCETQGLSQTEGCNSSPCPVDAVVGDWTSWSECSESCGNGTQTKIRTCDKRATNGGQTCAQQGLASSQNCKLIDCPVDGVLSAWSEWTACNCSESKRDRTRSCSPARHGGISCMSAILTESEDCTDTQSCPASSLSAWSDWSSCSETCGNGQHTRSRNCTGGDCGSSPLSETGDCFLVACSGNGWGNWSDWVCSVTCGNGLEQRSRICNGAVTACIGDFQQSRECQPTLENCPVDGIESDWSDWNSCTASCGKGTQSRQRTCTAPTFGGNPCGDLEESRPCNPTLPACAIDAAPRPWSRWGPCSVTCETGMRTRTRTCTAPLFGGQPCKVHLSENESCTGILSSCQATYNDWEQWTGCSETCGPDGLRTRRRTCTGRALCDGVVRTQTERCPQTVICVVDGRYESWQAWDTCSVTCGTGTQRRQRMCVPPVGGGRPCQGSSTGERECSTPACSSEYPKVCTLSCGGLFNRGCLPEPLATGHTIESTV